MKWIWVIVLAIIGVLAAIVAIEYFAVPIHHLPSFMGGHHGKHHGGHYRKRGAGAAVVAIVAFAIAGFLAYRIVKADRSASAGAGTGVGTPNQPAADPPAPPA
jgi:hypothetical protein